MSDHDDRLARHLRGLAATIDLSPGDPAAAVSRAARRRQRRRTGVGAALGTFAVLAAVVAADVRPDDEVRVGTPAGELTELDFDWTVVDPEVSALVGSAAVTADGTVYGLSTAPGPIDFEDPPPGAFRQVLYRSTDGAEWTEASLPEDLWPSAVSAADDTVYAVGTGTVGGDTRTLRLVSSADGAGTWDDLDIPFDLAALDARYPGEIVVLDADVAAGPAGVVAAVSVGANLDIVSRAPTGVDATNGWDLDDTGVTIFGPPVCNEFDDDGTCLVGGVVPATTTSVPATPPPPPTSAPATPSSGVPAESETATTAVGTPLDPVPPPTTAPNDGYLPVVARLSWNDLGVDDELRDLALDPAVHVFAAPAGATAFTDVLVPASGANDDGAYAPFAGSTSVMATADGFRLVAADTGGYTHVLRSPDGITWEQPALDVSGSPIAAGLLAGRPAVMTVSFDADGAQSVRLVVEYATGLMSQMILHEADPGREAYTMVGAIGPLGAVLTLGGDVDGDGEPGDAVLLVSTDGASVSQVDIADHLPGPTGGLGAVTVTVTADAVTATVLDPPDDREATPAGTRVLVGTPRG